MDESTGWIVAFFVVLAFSAFSQWLLRKSLRLNDKILATSKELVSQRDVARRHATGWRDVAVDEGFGEGDGEDVLPWEEDYLQSRENADV